MQEMQVQSLGEEDPPCRRKWQPTPVFLLGKSHWQRSLTGYIHGVTKFRRDWACACVHTHTHTHTHIHRIILIELSSGHIILWPPDAKSWLTGKDPDAGKDLRAGGEGGKGEKDEMVGWHHWLNGHEFEQTPGDSEGWESLAWCNLWGHEESDTTEWLSNNTKYLK